MYKISIFLIGFFSFTNAEFNHFEMRDDLRLNDQALVDLYHAAVISPDEFPKARLFLENLIERYPNEFSNVSFYKVKSPYPFAGLGIIGIPYEWLVKLEAKIPVAQKWTEWALLHEAGHIHHQHLKVMSYLNMAKILPILISFAILPSRIVAWYCSQEEVSFLGAKFKTKDIDTTLTASCLSTVFLAQAFILYSKWIAEPQADSFAADHCQDPEALKAGALWINECTLDNSMYPSVEDRVKKIDQELEKRFNKN